MDQITSKNPFIDLLRTIAGNNLRPLMICLPGHVVGYDLNLQRAQVQCGLQRVISGEKITIPIITDVPVCLPGSEVWTLYHEIPVGTEGLIHFSQRAADTWINQGGISAPLDARMFSASDAFFEPGYRSNKTKITGLPAKGIGMSNSDGSIKISLDSSGINLIAGGSSILVTPAGITINGAILTHNGVNIGNDHRHTGVSTGNSMTGNPK